MASNPLHIPSGLASVVSDDPLVTADNLYLYADGGTGLFYADSENGSDTDGDGSRSNPYATFAKCVTVAGSGDVIVLRAGHAETITETQTLSVRVVVLGEGSGDNRPALTPNVASNGDMIVLTSDSIIRGIRVLESAQATTGNAIDATADSARGARVFYSEFVCGENDQGTKVAMHLEASYVHNCRFEVDAADATERPLRGLSGAMYVFDTVFAGGTYGWANTNTFLYGWGNSASGPVGIGGTSSVSVIQCAMTDGAAFDVTASPDYQIYPQGLGMTGHPLLSGEGLYVSGAQTSLQWVDSQTGTDGAGYGLSKMTPFASVKYAINTDNAQGLLVVLAGHSESVDTATILIDTGGLVVVGEGTGDNRPAITRNYSGKLIDGTIDDGVVLANLRFPRSSAAGGANARVTFRRRGMVAHQCEFKCGTHDGAAGTLDLAIDVGPSPSTYGEDCLIWSCEFASHLDARVAPSAAPDPAITGQDADNVHILNCTFDGGAYGWANGICAVPMAASLLLENVTLLRNSLFEISAVSYAFTCDIIAQVGTATGGSGLISNPVSPAP